MSVPLHEHQVQEIVPFQANGTDAEISPVDGKKHDLLPCIAWWTALVPHSLTMTKLSALHLSRKCKDSFCRAHSATCHGIAEGQETRERCRHICIVLPGSWSGVFTVGSSYSWLMNSAEIIFDNSFSTCSRIKAAVAQQCGCQEFYWNHSHGQQGVVNKWHTSKAEAFSEASLQRNKHILL